MANARLGWCSRGSGIAMKMRNAVASVLVVLLTACAAIVGADFDKAKQIAVVPIQGGTFDHVVWLPEGTAQLAWAVPDQMCRPIDASTEVRIRIEESRRSILTNSFKTQDLTWAHAHRSCHAYGYAYDATRGISGLKIEVPQGGATYKVTVSLSASPVDSARLSSLWFIYGGRAPTIKMFGLE